MKIRMLCTQRGSEDGIRVATFHAGEEYDLTGTPGARELAAAFVREGWAEPSPRVPAVPVASAPATHPARPQQQPHQQQHVRRR